MSTRTRVVLNIEGRIVVGPRAVRELLVLTARDPVDSSFPTWRGPDLSKRVFQHMVGMTKREKLLEQAKKLPLGCSLVLFQEPRHTRKKHSIYWKYILEKLGGY